MKRSFILAALALVFLALCGCDSAAEGSAPPSPEPSPSQAADSPQPETPPPPSEEPSSEEPQPSLGPLEELLAQYPVDDDHDAFLVPTGGRLGTLLVTVERGKEHTGAEFNSYQYTLSVWDPADMDEPIQTFEERADEYDWMELMDADFDGYMDFCCSWNKIVSNANFSLYLWDEGQGKFIRGATFFGRGGPHADQETQTIYNYTHESAASGTTGLYRWKDGELVCMREVERCYPDWEGNIQELAVWDLIGGEMREVYRGTFDLTSIFEEEEKWLDLDYCGEGPDLRELLAQYPVDDDHDAFLVPTGGRLGTLLVTVEREKQTQQDYLVRFAVWDPADMSQPIQRMEKTAMNVLRLDKKMDVNFDGYMDFSYTYAMGVQAELNYLWLWDEKAGRFVEEPEYSTISSPQINSETQVIEGWNRSSAAGDGVTTFHHWEEGKLVCVRRIELELTDWSEDDSLWLLTVQDRIDGKLIEVFRMECPWDSNDCWDEREKWSDLDYHGEE